MWVYTYNHNEITHIVFGYYYASKSQIVLLKAE